MCFKKQIVCPKCGKKTPKDHPVCEECGVNIAEQQAIVKAKAEATRIADNVIKHQGFFGTILPQYHGYKKRELRCQADKMIRDHMVKLLNKSKDTIKDLQSASMADPGMMKQLEDVLVQVDTFSRKIQHADYGYMETGDKSEKIGVKEIDRLLDFDKQNIETVMAIEGLTNKLKDSIHPQEMAELKAKVKAAITAYEQRDEFMRTWSVSK
jgi:hypothetical protein